MYLSADFFPRMALRTTSTLYGVHVTINASKMALSVLAAFLSCFFSLVFFTFGVFLAAATAIAAICGDKVLPSDLTSCFGTSRASRGSFEMSSKGGRRVPVGEGGAVDLQLDLFPV